MTTFLAFIFVLGMLVFVHELGHFIVAKRAGIRVEKFSLGFPPKLIGRKIGETEYCIGVIPLGGYVKMSGENITEDDYVVRPGDFMAASTGKRFWVIIAGPVMNFLLGIFLFFVIYWASGIPQSQIDSTEVGLVNPGAPADKAGLKVGSKIVSIDDNHFKDFTEIAAYIKQRPGEAISLAWTDGDTLKTATIITLSVPFTDSLGNTRNEGRIGIGPTLVYEPISPFAALKEATLFSFELTGQMLVILYRLLTRQESIKSLGGPVMIAQQAGAAAKQGLVSLLGLAAFLSINLAILNILPIPVLDGGHLVFLGIEAIKRKPVSIKGRIIAQQIGMGLLFILMAVVTYNDIVRLITGIMR